MRCPIGADDETGGAMWLTVKLATMGLGSAAVRMGISEVRSDELHDPGSTICPGLAGLRCLGADGCVGQVRFNLPTPPDLPQRSCEPASTEQ